MQTHYLDLARTLADEHTSGNRTPSADRPKKTQKPRQTARERVGHGLISIGQRIAPSDVQLTVSTGPPRA